MVQLDHRIVEPELYTRIKGMDNDVLVPRPGLEGMLAMLRDKPIAFNTTSAGIISSNNDAACQGVAANVTVGEPYLMFSEKPIGVMGKVELSPTLKWPW